jgi:hypothetical protein
MHLLYAEWLLLQDPRRQFTRNRPRLPGQEHPGLGLLAEIVALMVMMCERAGLDGIIFVPAHYYMAALGRRHLAFVSSRDAATYDALSAAVSGLSLADATSAIEDGRVADLTTGARFVWHTPLMALPVTEGLRGRLASADHEAHDVPRLRLLDST